MNPRVLVGAGIVLVLGGYAFGRYATPPKVVETVKIQTVEKQVIVTQEKVRVERVEVQAKAAETHERVTTTRKPDGTVTTVKTQDTATHEQKSAGTVATSDTNTVQKSESATKEIESRSRSPPSHSAWRVAGMVGLNMSSVLTSPLHPVYGLSIEHRLIVPVSTGVWGLSSGVGGVSISVEF